MEKSWNINSHLQEIKAEYSKRDHDKISHPIDFSKTGIKKATMLETIYRIFDKGINKVKNILSTYKKLFCYDHKKKEYTLSQEDNDPKTGKFHTFAKSLLDSILNFLIEIITKKKYEAEYIREIITALMKEVNELELILGLESRIMKKIDNAVEQILIGYYKQKSKEIRNHIEGNIIKLGDECVCLDTGSFFGMFDKKYAEFMGIFSNSIQTEAVIFLLKQV